MAAGHESGLHGGDAPPALSFLSSPRRISSAFHDNGINSDFSYWGPVPLTAISLKSSAALQLHRAPPVHADDHQAGMAWR
jgi:hypothetical protein